MFRKCIADLALAAILLPILLTNIECQSSERVKINTPPYMHLQREWVLADTEPVGTVVTRVHAGDEEDTELIYGLEQGPLYSASQSTYASPLPFAIDNMTGVIHINDTLKQRGGQNIFLYVTVSDGQLTAKTEVYVIIKNSSAPDSGHSGNPFSSQHVGAVRLRPPPFVGLPPNLQNYHRKPSVPPLLPLQSQAAGLPVKKNWPTILKPETFLPTNEFSTSTIGKLQNNIETKDNGQESSESEKENDELLNKVQDDQVSSSKTGPSEVTPAPQELVMILVPVVAVFAVIIGLSVIIWTTRNKFCIKRKSTEKSKESAFPTESNVSDDPSFVLKKWRGPKALNNRYEAWEKENQASSLKKSSKDIWEFPRHRIKVFSILGEGCFGQVYKCEALDIDGIPGASIVAVKTVKENSTEAERNDLVQELKVMKTLDPHPNVVRLLGCCTDREPIFVIMEYVSGGKLHSYLRNSREERSHGGSCLTSGDLTGFVYQIAKGMEYLSSKGIIHRDLAARNILIAEDRTCKVADFGFARDIALNQIYERKSEGRFPIRWMAPESLYDNIFSVKSDIWSFGILMWEIVTLGSTPYPGLRAAEVMKKVKEGYRLERPEHCKRELYNIMFYCWDKDPARRPTFTELVSLAEGLLLDETEYIELDRFPDHSYYNVLNLSGEKL